MVVSEPHNDSDVIETPRLWSSPHRTTVVAVLALMTFIAFESYAVITALPVVATDLQAESWYPFAFAATITTGLVGMVIGGNWADRSGVTTPLAVGGATFLLGLALCAGAPDMGVFVAGRLLQGFGGGIDSVLTYVLIARVIPQHLHARMFGFLVAAWLLPAVIGPFVTGVLIECLHWRTVFWAVLIGAAAALAALIRVASQAASQSRAVTIIGARGGWAMTACIGLVALHLVGHQQLILLIVGTALAVATIAVATYKLMPAGTLTARAGAPQLIALKGALGAAVAATDIYLTRFMQTELGYSPKMAGFIVAIGALGWVAGSWWQGRVSKYEVASNQLWTATGLVATGPLAVLTVVADLTPIHVAIAGCILMGLGMGMAYPRVTAGALAASDPAMHGNISSALQSIEQIATSVLIAVTGAILIITTDNYVTVYTVILVVGCLALGVLGAQRRVLA